MSPHAKDTNMSFALGDANFVSFALGDAKVPYANGFASQWNIGFIVSIVRHDLTESAKFRKCKSLFLHDTVMKLSSSL